MISISLKKRRSMKNKCSPNFLGPNHSPMQHNHFPKVIDRQHICLKEEPNVPRAIQPCLKAMWNHFQGEKTISWGNWKATHLTCGKAIPLGNTIVS